MTITIDDTWQHQGGEMYFKKPKRWVCLDCDYDYDTTSPYGAGCHAAKHGFRLPNARKKKPMKKSQSQVQIEPKIEKKSQITHNGLVSDVTDRNTNLQPRRRYSKDEYETWVKNQGDNQRTKKLVLLSQWKLSGLLTDEELEEKKFELGLAERPDPKIKIQKQETREKWLMLIAMERNPRVLQCMWTNFYLLEQAGVL